MMKSSTCFHFHFEKFLLIHPSIKERDNQYAFTLFCQLIHHRFAIIPGEEQMRPMMPTFSKVTYHPISNMNIMIDNPRSDNGWLRILKILSSGIHQYHDKSPFCCDVQHTKIT